ncbi:rod shape-determining protein MreC [Blattabacterium cuenoti]|uniref:rod shape-determining protein MreC n=1 Tax=Blattabacterium cuenoti TaxID=1653831 RepID=UPI00163BA6CB|nr:rod shape-determining protein MreC [Blattabacterium cuenoti]
MREFFNFFFRCRFFILFILLESTVAFFSFSNFEIKKYFYTGSSNLIIGNIYSYIHKLSSYFLLDIENKRLINENKKLRNENLSHKIKKISQDFKGENIEYLQQYIFTPVKIVNNTISERENYITINKGSIDGIKADMGIIFPNGIAGIVTKTSPHFSVAISLLNPKIKVNARLKKNKYFGTITWDGVDYKYLILYDIPKYSIIRKGDIVETDGKSGTFPEGIAIGEVYSYQFNQEHANYIIKVKLLENFSTIESAYVVKNLFKKEWEELQLYQVDK